MKIFLKIITLVFVAGLTNLSSQQAVIDDEGIYLMCEKMPELVGGTVSYTHLTLPTKA